MASSDATTEIHRGREHPATEDAQALHLRDGRLVEIAPSERVVEEHLARARVLAAHALGKRAARLVLLLLGRAEVVARAEIVAGAGEDDDADVVVGVGLVEGGVHFLEQPPRLRVLVARAVEDDLGDAVVLFVKNNVVFHEAMLHQAAANRATALRVDSRGLLEIRRVEYGQVHQFGRRCEFMALWKPDQTFYPSARMAMQAPREQLGYVVTFNPTASNGKHDALCVLDLDPKSKTYSQVVGRAEVPNAGDELHHFGWNACSAALCPYAPHPHIERRYLLVPGLRSSRIYIFDTKPDPRSPKLVKTIEAEEIASRTGYSRPHTVHCGPDAIYVSALGSPSGDGPGGIFLLDHESFDVLGRWEVDRGPQRFAYDFWWHLGWDVAVTSEWGTPNMIENGVVPELLLGNKYGHAIHIWNLRNRRHLKSLDLGAENQMALELRPSHDPTKTFGFVGVVISTKDLSASIWLWYRDSGDWKVRKVIEIPAEPADESLLPPALKPFKAVPPLITDINLSLDDKFLYVACFGTGDLKQYDVSDPFKPRETGSVRLGGIVSHAKHPKSGPLNGASQMIELSRDGRRIYMSNSLYGAWDAQFYPEGVRGWVAKIDCAPAGGMTVDPNFFTTFDGERPHQIRLEGGDSSSDSFCYP